MHQAKKFKIVTLGCRTNQYESQAYQNQLEGLGYQQALENEEAEICIVNTCTVTESADSHSRHEIRKLSRENPDSKLVVTGCFAERQPHVIKELGATEVVSNKEKENLLKIVLPEQDIPEFSIKNFDSHTRAFVKVQDGCNSFCTYCIIPYVRGRSRSRTRPEILQEVRDLIANGYKEVVITGINVGDYDGNVEPKERLSDLIRAIDAIPGLERLRLSSIDPDEVDDDLADAILNGRTTCPSMHIVLQSGSNVTLKKMNRKYTRQIFLETIHKMRQAHADFTFTTDIIVGFPGETEEDFQETLDVMKETQFAKVHMFPYSERPRTRAALYPNKVPHELIKERKQILLRQAEQDAFELRQKYVGRTMSVLTEGFQGHNEAMMAGHTANFLNVYFEKAGIGSNQIVSVRLVENTPSGLFGIIEG